MENWKAQSYTLENFSFEFLEMSQSNIWTHFVCLALWKLRIVASTGRRKQEEARKTIWQKVAAWNCSETRPAARALTDLWVRRSSRSFLPCHAVMARPCFQFMVVVSSSIAPWAIAPKGGQNTRYLIPELELPEPRPEVSEPEILDHNFG
jgi:hypothetical protein